MQGWDSVEIHADVELGGSEQLFSLLVARDLQQSQGQEPQVALTMPILVGTDGVRRMGKSLGNYIGVAESAEEQFGKIMSSQTARCASISHCLRSFRLMRSTTPEPRGQPEGRQRRVRKADRVTIP